MVTTQVTTAKRLLKVSSDFRALLKCWVRDRRCPFPLEDLLLEHGLELQAKAAHWAANKEDRPVFLPVDGERSTPCGPYPAQNDKKKFFWITSCSFKNMVYQFTLPGQNYRLSEGSLDQALPLRDSLLLMLDHWKEET